MTLVKCLTRSILFALSLVTGQALADEVRIAVAANFTDAMKQITPLFEKETGYRTIVSFGSTGKLYAQIANGAPYDLYLAADTARPMLAQSQGYAVPDSHFVYAVGKLALWSAHGALFDDAMAFLESKHFDHLALANPKTAPYGVAARQVMEHLGVWEDLSPKLVRGDSIAQTFQFVATENAEVGFVALSQVKAWKGERGIAWQIPQHLYAPIEQGAVLLKRGKSNPASVAFIAFLKSEAARKIIERLGYGTTRVPMVAEAWGGQ